MIRRFLIALTTFSMLAAAPLHAQVMPDSAEIDWAWNAFLDGDHGEAFDILMQAAEAGDAPSQAMMGWAFEIGKAVPENTQEAIRWYQLAALQDYGDAYSSLGLMYYYGRSDLEQDYAIAEAYYEAGITVNDPESYSFLAYMFQEGHGVQQDFRRAADLYQSGADFGDGYGASQLGYLFREGLGVVKDEIRARELYQRAIDLDYEYAYADLGHMMHRGLGGPEDLDQALDLYVRAIELDVPYGGIGGSYLILENLDLYPDPVMGLSLCFWAVENASVENQQGYKEDCDFWAVDFNPEDIARAYQLAATH